MPDPSKKGLVKKDKQETPKRCLTIIQWPGLKTSKKASITLVFLIDTVEVAIIACVIKRAMYSREEQNTKYPMQAR